jgi:hypothetical protein
MASRRLRRIVAVAGASGLTIGLFSGAAAAQSRAHAGGGAAIGRLDAAQARTLGRDADRSVIIVFKDQVSDLPATRALTPARTAALSRIQAPVVRELGQLRAPDVRKVSLINAVTATVSAGEARRLAADPAVAEVVPNATFHLDFSAPRGTVAHPTTSTARSATSSACQTGTNGLELDPEALSAIHANTNLPGAGPTAASLGITGAGVTVAYMAEGFDINSPEFVRPDGQHVFVDYKDFTGEGSKATTSGGEASLDTSSIAAQGRLTYSTKLPDGTKCKFRILGAAPGASIVGLKVFPDNYDATTTSLLLGINYAVATDHVDVLSESFGYNPLPDTTSDVIRMADEAAFKAGTVVDVSTGDAGPTSTVGSPSTDPDVIAAGASTTYRTYAQADIENYTQIGAKGWEDDNISGLSSGGSTEGLKGPNLVAPGDLNWVTCNPAPNQFAACISGGTSEAAPLTSATAALVIQAYRKTHRGASPTPTLVKRILTSTATDLGEPPGEQGSGLLDAYQAVLAAESVKTSTGAPAHKGVNLLTDTNYIAATAPVRTAVTRKITVTNAGTGRQSVSIRGRVLSAPKTLESSRLTEDGNNWVKVEHFTVAPGTSHLDANVATVGSPNAYIDVTLLDPLGRLAIDGLPQGNTGTSNVGVRYPAAGKWTAYLTDVGAKGTKPHPVSFTVTAEDWQTFGTVTPSGFTLAPNATQTVSVTMDTPATAGDESAALELSTAMGQTTSIPVALRSLVPISDGTGDFSASVLGGNGRGGAPSSTEYFVFDVPAGQPELDVATSYANGPDNTYSTYLVSPEGETLGHASNQLVTGGSALAPTTKIEPGTDSHVLTPEAGRWTLVVAFANPASGVDTAAELTGTITFAPVKASETGLPASTETVVATGSKRTVHVTVTNTSAVPQTYFLDARTDREVTRKLVPLDGASVTLPLAGAIPQWIVPTDTTGLLGEVDATAPVTFDMSPYLGNFGGELNGDPQIGATSHGDDATASWKDDPITPGIWNLDPGLVGVFGTAGSPKDRAVLSLTASTAGFNHAITTAYGDLWDSDGDIKPVTVQPGQTATLVATLAPTKASTVNGVLYLDTATSLDPFGNPIVAGDQAASFPYSYTTGS